MGHQETVEEMRAEKAEKYNELKEKRKSEEYEAWFLRYRPTDGKNIEKPTSKPKTTTKRKTNKNKKTKKRKLGIFF